MKIPIGITGRITRGEQVNCFVKVLDDSLATGGFLILTSANPNMQPAFDDWVEDEVTLARYFMASHWIIEWESSGN